ncbi:hypothetical protein [Paenisporosarcina sp. TG-14]|uniref:hypothetical protein n=1 Tax=Paenisporosarcina sp. TG-14 TaxID=1231057 RepID=UPI0002DB273D|nr:hypothetical protein [Paenisporosarcina sp. TG-14]
MSSSKEYDLEKEKIDFYMNSGYEITKVTESLDGEFIEFEQPENPEDKQKLVLYTADGRKYLSTFVFEQQKKRLVIDK